MGTMKEGEKRRGMDKALRGGKEKGRGEERLVDSKRRGEKIKTKIYCGIAGNSPKRIPILTTDAQQDVEMAAAHLNLC